jgi:hypothetical protein
MYFLFYLIEHIHFCTVDIRFPVCQFEKTGTVRKNVKTESGVKSARQERRHGQAGTKKISHKDTKAQRSFYKNFS